MKAIHKPDPDPEDHDIILIVFGVAMVLVLCFVSPPSHAEKFWFNQTIKELLHDYDSEADRRGDATDQTLDYEQTAPIFSPNGFEGFATQNPNGSIYVNPALDGLEGYEGGYYDY